MIYAIHPHQWLKAYVDNMEINSLCWDASITWLACLRGFLFPFNRLYPLLKQQLPPRWIGDSTDSFSLAWNVMNNYHTHFKTINLFILTNSFGNDVSLWKISKQINVFHFSILLKKENCNKIALGTLWIYGSAKVKSSRHKCLAKIMPWSCYNVNSSLFSCIVVRNESVFQHLFILLRKYTAINHILTVLILRLFFPSLPRNGPLSPN